MKYNFKSSPSATNMRRICTYTIAKGKFFRIRTSEKTSGANVILAANVYQQDELRGAKKDIRSFAA